MILSQSSQIAVKAIAHISGNGNSCVNVKELAETTGENAHTIAKVLQNLVKHGLLSSITGPQGGFFLTEKQSKGKLSDIVKSIDGINTFEKCVLGMDKCSASHPCLIHGKYAPLRNEIGKIFNETSLEQLAPGH